MTPRTGTATESTSERELAQAVTRNLLPPALPLRRELELAAAIDDGAAATCYYDVLWPNDHTVVIAVIQVAADGLEGAMTAAALKAVFRAALEQFRAPAAALEACRDIEAFRDMHAAVIRVDLSSGAALTARLGHGRLFFDDGSLVPAEQLALATGASMCLAIGTFEAMAPAPHSHAANVSDLAQQTLRDTSGALAVVIVVYKRASRPAGMETATFANALTEIPRAQAWLEQFCKRQAVEAETAAGVALALDEIFTNVISYAFADNDLHRIDVEAVAAHGKLSLEVRDDGAPFNPLQTPAPDLDADLADREVGGLGIHLVKTIADTVSYRREKGWNILRLCKKASGSDNHGD